MEKFLLVKTLEICQVSPSLTHDSLNSTFPKSLPLTFFDILWLRFPPIHRLFFYESLSSIHSIIPKLKHSLSLTLQHFLPLAGNLTWPQNTHKPIITFSNENGVSLTISETSMNFHLLSTNTTFQKAEECHCLIPQLPVSHERSSVMALQITLFPKFGFSIGITTHHAVLDGRTSTSFMKCWAKISKLGSNSPSLVAELMPFYDRSLIKDPKEVENIYLNTWLNHQGPNNKSLKLWEFKLQSNLVRGTFQLTRETLEKLRRFLSTKSNIQFRLSTFVITCSYIWVCLVKALGKRDKKTRLAFPVDCRSRLKPVLPPTYFGNCIRGRVAVAETEGLSGQDGVTTAMESINETITSLSKDDILNGLEKLPLLMFGKHTERIDFQIAGSPLFEVYSTDFGWGRSKKVDMTSIDGTGAISLSDGKDGNGGIEIGLVLKVLEIEAFASVFCKGLEAL